MWRLAVLLTSVASLFAVAGWLGYVQLAKPQSHHSSGGGSLASVRLYNSLDRLSEVSDLVVIGEVTGVISTQADTGLDGTADPIRSTWYEVDVQETLKGETTDTITVVRTDPGHFRDGEITTLQSGESVALFLMKRTSEEFPLVKVADVFYVPVSFDNGVFDVIPSPTGAAGEESIRPRMSNLFEADTFTKSEVQQAIGGR